MNKPHLMGMLDLSGGFVDITDPWYPRSFFARRNQLGVLPGKYRCYIVQQDHEIVMGNGEVFHSIETTDGFIIHESVTDDPDLFHKSIDFLMDQIGVDTATAGFFSGMPDGQAPWAYLCACRNGDVAGHDPFIFTKKEDGFDGFICDTGIGDGVYPLYAHFDKDNQIDALKLTFWDDEDSEE